MFGHKPIAEDYPVIVSIEKLNEKVFEGHYRTIFYRINGQPDSNVDTLCIGEAIVAIADHFGYDLVDVAKRYGR